MLPSMEPGSLRDKCIAPIALFSRVSTSLCNFSKRTVSLPSVPQRNLCSASTPDAFAELLTTNKLLELVCLALYLMYEKKQGKRSFWYPYIRQLDRQRGRGQLAVESPLLWSEDELAYLTGSPAKAEVLARAAGIRREYDELDTVWSWLALCFSLEIFKQAFVAIQSCVVHLQKVSLARRFAFVPLGPPFAVVGAVQLVVVVDRPYEAGEPIVVCFVFFFFFFLSWCGPQPNSKLLINYGFVDEDNCYDRIVFLIAAALNTEDPQYQDKRMVAQRDGRLSVQVFRSISDMLPYLRLGYVSDPSMMQTVISSQGPICPMVRLEKKILNACLQATLDLINQLPDHTVSPWPAPCAPILK
ncbi:hypothetical protein P3X46_032627 [Hevea brasiliensis]|uniref:Rubisco LSMT substrate-binding domain-containing protein n=1 Tax=Hevea brasiliensis TaxID=3981 RepID=A0ABQ9KDU8_HEVBR|nr:hypothetical protein P3X46_032627 [Hevea brasiliensis]